VRVDPVGNPFNWATGDRIEHEHEYEYEHEHEHEHEHEYEHEYDPRRSREPDNH
jgi:26S proteasome regulatory subunit N1